VHHEYALLTPEKVAVSFRIAGLGSRVLAYLLDTFIAWTALAMVLKALADAGAIVDELALVAALMVLTFGTLAYFTLFEGLWNGRTPGKWALRLRVRSHDGTPATLAAALFRNLMRPADGLPGMYLVGLVSIFITPRSQRLGDLAAGTIVVHEPAASPRFAAAPHRFGVHPFEEAVGPLSKMTLEEYFAVKRVCDRFPELSAQVQERLLREVWTPFAVRHGVPGIADVHPVYLMEAVVMRYGRTRGLL
jgi:uncharacterized RDD family membrane protein YckC